MKITINVDCTPEEARRYMGLPDVAPMQEAMLREMQERMKAHVAAMESGELIKTWLPTGLETWLEWQKAFWNQMTSLGASRKDES